MRSSARSAVSIDARDSLQPVDHAGRAAMAREGMLQLVVVVEAFWPNAGCTRPVTQTTRGGPITRRGTLPPPPSPSNPLRHPLTRCETPSTRAHPACRPGLETVGRGEGGRHSSPGAGQRERGPPNSSLGRYTPPTHIGAGRRSYRRTPSRAAWLTVLGRAPQAASFIGSRHVWVRRRVERRRGLRQSLASQVSPRCGYVPLI